MRLLCIAAAHEPIGYVAVAGRGLDETSLARMTGCLESEAKDLLGELERNGVFSRDRQGRIFSRRMIRDAKKAAIARKNGKSGGNPNLSKQKSFSASDNLPDKPSVKPQKPETRSHTDKYHHPDDGFDEWYQAYPKHVGRGQAARAYKAALKIAEPLTLLEGVKRYAAERAGQDAKFTALPATWLNGERWLDEASPSEAASDESKYSRISNRYRGAA
tara:strand:- start:31689 stop:32339 length:651 start_codon:yes stop_codon:yes gene_type:complete